MMTENDYVITNHISAEEYMEIRKLVGFSLFPVDQAAEGLKHSSYICCLRKDNLPIVVGRIVSDQGYVVYIADVMVRPEYQRQGLGSLVVNQILDHIRSTLKPGYKIMISLMAAKGKEAFYEKYGFISRPNERFGCGMHQWIEG